MVRRPLARLVASSLIAAGVLVVASACGPGFLDGLTGGRADAGSGDAGSDAEVDARTCTLARQPERPGGNDDEAAGALQFAVDAIRIDDGDGLDGSIAPSHGLDLDLACTCPEPETCNPPPDASPPRCDRDGGTDNALARLFAALGGIQPDAFGPDFATKSIRKGAYSMLMSIAGWNRKPNDPKVFASMYVSQGMEGSVDGGGAVPQFDGNDTWTVDPDSLQQGDQNVGENCQKNFTACTPKYLDSNAYVRDGVLVAHGDVPLSFSSDEGTVTIELTGLTVVAHIFENGDAADWHMDGELVGRWSTDKILTSLGRVPISGTPLCQTTGFFDIARAQICPAADLARDPADDQKGKPCEALSAAIHFTATAAKLGTIFRGPGGAPSCVGFDASCN